MTVESALDHIRKNEELLLQPHVRNSEKLLSELIADEFVELGSSGRIYNKSDVIKSLSTQRNFEWSIENFRAWHIEQKIILATYTLSLKHESGGSPKKSIRSSLWKLFGEEWKIIFHQGTSILNK